MSGLQRIKDNRHLILLAEIGALLHDLGKLSEEFITQQSPEITGNKYLFKHNLILGRSIKFPYSIISKDNSQFMLMESDIKSIKEEFLNEIVKSSYSQSELKKILIAIFKNKYGKEISVKKSKKLLDFIYEYYSYSRNGDTRLSESLQKIPLQVLGEEIHIADIIAKHHKGENYIVNHSTEFINLLKSIDGLDSGVDKGILHDKGKQMKNNTYQATSFGYEENTIDILKLKPIRDHLYAKLTSNLIAIEQAYNQYQNSKETKEDYEVYISKLQKIRNNIHESVKTAFLKGLGDTRRSGNDVTLWDHSYSVASLYKSAIVKNIYENNWTEPYKIKWKIIGIQYDKLGLIEKAHKLADIAGYKKLTEDVDEKIKKTIEEEIPLGNEVYRDETGIYFTGPDIDEDKLWNLIRELIVYTFQKETNGEVIPHITISTASRSLVILTELLEDSRHNFLLHEITPKWTEDWNAASSQTVGDIKQCSFCKKQHKRDCVANGGIKEYQIDICPVCGVHPKCEHQEICKHCLERRESRIEKWKNKKYQTIWIDEIADKNKRIAVITGRFNLTGWLKGEFLNTIFSQTLEDNDKNWTKLRNELKKCLISNEEKSDLLKRIASESYHDERAQVFYDKIVVDRNPQWQEPKVDWTVESDCQIAAERLLLTIFRKHPSPARLRRIWTSTEKFWEDVQNELETKQKIYLRNSHDIRFKRLEIKLKNNGNITKTIQNVEFENINILMYFDGEKLISAQNLEFTWLNKEMDLNNYIGKSIRINREDESNSKFKNFEIKEISWGMTYCPFLNVLLSPISFQFIVPANSVPDVLQLIQHKYSTEMGEIAGRLPLNVGVIFFDYKTALYATINASRKMLKGFEDEPAEQFLVNSEKIGSSIELIKKNKGNKKMKVENTTKISSKYYRNFIVVNSSSVDKRNGYFKSFVYGEEVNLLNAFKLEKDDEVVIYTNHFDFEFLDSTARRLEIGYNNGKRISQSDLRGPRPYYLEEFSTVFDEIWGLFKTLTISQIKKIQSELAKLHLDWTGYENSEEFETQIENILINHGTHKWWDSVKDEHELLKQVCLDKTIFDILEFYTSILKLKSGCDTNE
jgi:hypothetical protein